MLISVSIFQDVHDEEAENNKIHACIAHSAGASPKDLSENEVAGVAKTIYDLQIITGTGEWEDMFTEAKNKINAKGGQEGHCVASANNSSDDGGVIIVLSWESLVEGNLRESIRPATCMEQCTIF